MGQNFPTYLLFVCIGKVSDACFLLSLKMALGTICSGGGTLLPPVIEQKQHVEYFSHPIVSSNNNLNAS